MRRIDCCACLLASLLLISAVAAAPQTSSKRAARFKPGDRVEFDFGGKKQGTVREIQANGRVKVQEDGKSHTFPFRPDELKKLSRPKATDPADENPFATDEERQQSRQPRTWTSSDGKFRVEATLVEVVDGKVRLKRDDGKLVAVSLDKLSESDRRYLAAHDKLPARDDGSEDAPSEEADDDGLKPQPVDLDSARQVDTTGSREWQYRPGKNPAAPALRSVHVSLGKKADFFEKTTAMLFSPAKKAAYVVLVTDRPGDEGLVSRVVACDLARGKVESSAEFGRGRAPIAISPDGARLLARSAGKGDKRDLLTLCSLAGRKAEATAAWRPYGQLNGGDRNVDWATFLDTRHLLTLNGKGQLVFWDLEDSIRPIYRLDGERNCHPGLSADGRFAAIRVKGGVFLLELASGKPAGFLPIDAEMTWNSRLAFDATGKQLALMQPGRLTTWDLTTQELVRDFAVPQGGHGGALIWVDEERLLVDGRLLVDARRRIHLWTFHKLTSLCERHGDQLWFVAPGSGGADTLALSSARLPNEGALALVGDSEPDDLLVVRPGMQVNLSIETAQTPELKAALTHRLQKNGLEVVEGSAGPLRLIVRSKTGTPTKLAYRRFGSFVATEHQFTPNILEMMIEAGGQVVWNWSSQSWAPHRLELNEGESVDQALNRAGQRDPGMLAHVWIPAYIAALPAGKEPGQTNVPAGGE